MIGNRIFLRYFFICFFIIGVSTQFDYKEYNLVNMEKDIKPTSTIARGFDTINSNNMDLFSASFLPINNPIEINEFEYNFSTPFYDQSMFDFHKLDQCHSIANGSGITIVVI